MTTVMALCPTSLLSSKAPQCEPSWNAFQKLLSGWDPTVLAASTCLSRLAPLTAHAHPYLPLISSLQAVNRRKNIEPAVGHISHFEMSSVSRGSCSQHLFLQLLIYLLILAPPALLPPLLLPLSPPLPPPPPPSSYFLIFFPLLMTN